MKPFAPVRSFIRAPQTPSITGKVCAAASGPFNLKKNATPITRVKNADATVTSDVRNWEHDQFANGSMEFSNSCQTQVRDLKIESKSQPASYCVMPMLWCPVEHVPGRAHRM